MKLPSLNLGPKRPNDRFSPFWYLTCNDFLSIVRNHQQKMFIFNVSAQIGHPPASMWEPKGLKDAFLLSKKPLQNLIFLTIYLLVSNVFSNFLFNRNQQRKMFEFNVSARMGPPPATMWEPEGLMEAFLPLKKPLQNWLKPVNTVKQLFSVQLPEVQPPVSLGTKTEHLSSRYLHIFLILGRFSRNFLINYKNKKLQRGDPCKMSHLNVIQSSSNFAPYSKI